MRTVLGILLALACACGGGSGGTTPTNGSASSPAQQLLEGCGYTTLRDFLTQLGIIEGLLDPSESNPATITVLDIDTEQASVAWEFDSDGDMVADLSGSLRFIDSQGMPETAADVSLLSGGLDDLDAMIPGLPDGTELVVAISTLQPPPFDVTLTFAILGGAVDSVTGSVNAPGLECLVVLDFTGASFQSVGGTYPNFTITLTLVSESGNLEGTVAFNGTNQATAEVTLDGDPEILRYHINLDTGAVTAVS
jgi:hypothetical protein